MPSNHVILCRPLLLLPSIFPNIRVFSSESALCIRWPKLGKCKLKTQWEITTSLLEWPLSKRQELIKRWSGCGKKGTLVQWFCCSVTKSCLTLCDPMVCSTPGFSVLYYLLGFIQTHVHWVNDATQPSHPLSPSSPHALSLSQHQGVFQWVNFSHQMGKLLELLVRL